VNARSRSLEGEEVEVMKTLLRKTNRTAFDNLLRSHFGQPAGSASACPEFDPDRANAYIERGLAGVERARYERHLSDCYGCRTSVVALARMADADSTSAPVPNIARTSGLGESGWLASLKAGLWVIASPRWAIVAAALLVISISIPVLVWRGGVHRSEQDTYVAQVSKDQLGEDQPTTPAAPMFGDTITNAASGSANSNSQTATSAKVAERELQRTEKPTVDLKKGENETAAARAAGGAQPAAGDAAAERPKLASGYLAESRDDAKSKETSEKAIPHAPAAAPQPTPEEDKAQAKINKEDALKLPPEDKGAASVRTLKPGTVDSGPKTERDKNGVAVAAITSKDGVAPKRKATLEAEQHAALTVQSGRSRALVGGEGSRVDRSHSPERKVGKKSFWLSRGIWTDSEYNSDQKLPVVTVVRDSDVYKEMLEKNNKLKSFFKGFSETESAIIVFKGAVYNLIPQSQSK